MKDKSKTKQLEELLNQAAPHQSEMEKFAGEILALQEEIIKGEIKENWPDATIEEAECIGAILGQTAPDQAHIALSQLRRNGVKLSRVIHDMARRQFILIGTKPK